MLFYKKFAIEWYKN